MRALKFLVLITMYLVTFFMRRLEAWFEFDLFLLVLMSMYTVIFCGKGGRLFYVVLTIGFFVRLVLEISLSFLLVPAWYAFVCAITVFYCVSTLFFDETNGGK